MPARTLNDEIGRLYQGPLEEFTAARNALAKQAGKEAPRIRALPKPSVPAWAVNQLYWRDRHTWDALVAAADNARAVNRAVLAGKSGDVRAANQVHEEAVESAFKATVALLSASGHPLTDATRQAMSMTLRALPGSEPPGQLAKPLQPGGFDALAGLTLAARPSASPRSSASSAGSWKLETGSSKSHPSSVSRKPPIDAHAAARQRQAEASAARALKDAEADIRRSEFDLARLEREERRAQESREKAREVLERAKADLQKADKDLDAAADAARAAKEKTRKAQETLARMKKVNR
jgi:hypothetical protein